MTRHVTQGRNSWQTKPAMTEARRREIFGPLSTEPELTLSYNLKLLAALCLLIGFAAGAWIMTP